MMDTSKLALFVLFFFASNVPQFRAQAKTGFVFTIPKRIHYGSPSQFCLTLQDENVTSQIVTMTLAKSGKNVTVVEDSFPVGKQKCRKFSAPKPGEYDLLLSNETGVMHESVKLKVLGDKLITLVQTDKPTYKPGQKVKFRVLTLTSDLKPRVGEIKNIFIIDPQGIRVKQYLNVQNQGITSLEFQLAAATKLGRWSIEILVDESDEEHKQVTFGEFEVKEYVLPRFEVEIIPPPYIMTNQKTFTVKVCAKYTYGKNVTGFLDADVCWGSSYAPSQNCHKEVVQINGCHSFSSNVTESEDNRWYSHYGKELEVKASVTEEGTGVIVSKSHSGPSLTYKAIKIQLDDYSNGYFKPGLPYYGKAIVTKPDGTPSEGELIKITARDYSNDLIFSKVFTTDSYGVVVYSLCSSFTEKSKAVSIYAEADGYSSDDLESPTVYHEIRQWFSPSLSYVQIPRTDSTHKCGDRLTLSIPFTTQANTDIEFNYQVMAKGKVIKTGQISYDQDTSYPGKDLILPPSDICLQKQQKPTPPPVTPVENVTTENIVDGADMLPPMNENEQAEPMLADGFWGGPHRAEINSLSESIIRPENVSDVVSNFLLDLPITPVMSPKFTLLLYYIRPDGEVVADSMQFLVNPCFENEVTMKFNRTTVLPGENVGISLKAVPGSVCGVGIVDKSVNILGGKHQITPELVFSKLEELNSANFDEDLTHYYRDEYCEKHRKLGGKYENYYHYTSSYVDAMQAFKSSGFMVISNLDLETRPCHGSPLFMSASDGESNWDLRPHLNTVPDFAFRSTYIVSDRTKIRSHFPETWMWNLMTVGETGETVIREEAPHTVTSWIGNAMCLDQEKGFGISKLTSLTTFQPFFLSLNLPYAAVRGERLPIIFTVYNYLEKCLHIQLTLDLGKKFKLHNSKQHQNSICVCGGKSYNAKFYATPIEIGHLPVFAKAEIITGLCGNAIDIDTTYVGLSDAVKRQMLVKAEGVEQHYTHVSYICSKVDEPVQEIVILPLPEQGVMVKDSARGDVQVIGDIMGPALTNLKNLVQVPVGCGEQNMVYFVPNILVLKYLNSIGKINEEIEEKAVQNMEIGYQSELTYQHNDGSYSAFGKRDAKGSVWLTAFVVKSYAQARPYIYIDDKDVTLSLKFLRNSQLETGCFRETGKVFSSYMMGGLGADKDTESSNTALTAYVLIALLSANVNTTEPTIVNAVSCINKDFQLLKKKMDPYTLALIAYANSLHQTNSRTGHEVLNILDSKAHKNGSLRYWSRETAKPKPVNTWYYYSAPSAEVEMTAYALMAYLNLYGERAVERSHSIAMWLSQQRNPNGGFSSTQDTVVGLQALSEFASLAYSKEGTELKVTVSGKQFSESLSVSEKEKTTLLLQTVPIPVLPNEITISTEGVGCALVQFSVTYNKQPKDIQGDEKQSFHLKVSTKKYENDIDKCDKVTITISVGNNGRQEFENGMGIVTVKMVTSWTPESQSLIKLKSRFPILGIKRYEYSDEEAVLTFYFDEFTKIPKVFRIDVKQNKDLAISNAKPAEVKVFQYYESDVSAVQAYTLKTICGTKAEIPRNNTAYNEMEQPNQVRIDLGLIPGFGNNVDDVCPVCIPIKHQPKNLKEIVCNSTAAYKALAGRKGSYSLKLIQNLRSEKKSKLNVFSNYKMVDGCDCTVLESPVKKVLIFVQKPVSSDNMLELDRTSMAIITDKNMEKLVRKFRKSCSVTTGTL